MLSALQAIFEEFKLPRNRLVYAIICPKFSSVIDRRNQLVYSQKKDLDGTGLLVEYCPYGDREIGFMPSNSYRKIRNVAVDADEWLSPVPLRDLAPAAQTLQRVGSDCQ